MRLAPIIARLEGLGFAHVDGIGGLADIDRALKSLPAAFVAPADETAGENRLASGATDQRVRVTFSVVMAIAPTSARGPAQPAEDIHELAGQVLGALAGWAHPDMSAPTEYRRGRLLDLRPDRMLWGLDFTTAYHLRTIQ